MPWRLQKHGSRAGNNGWVVVVINLSYLPDEDVEDVGVVI